MPRSIEAERALGAARQALASGALARSRDAAWHAASAAAQIGDEQVLESVVELVSTLVAQDVEGAEQLRRYAEACLEDARKGTRPRSAFERLIGRDKRPR